MPTSTRATSDRAGRIDGFTLIELALVLLIIGVLATLAVPSLSTLGAARIDTSARRLGTTLSYLHDEAALRGRDYRVTFDLDRARYSILTRLPYSIDAGEFQRRWDAYAEDTELPVGVNLISVSTASGVRSSGSVAVDFLPEDAREDLVITLAGEGGARRELAVDGVTGRVAITRSTDYR